ncbi:MAG: VTT domain-containing protein [Opitutales bacterium]|nr:VTT domain-containing protein [Opitutales bacterium]
MAEEAEPTDEGPTSRRGYSKKVWILPVLAAAGIALGAWQPLGFDEILAYGEQVGTSPLFLGAAVGGMIVFFTLGLPGSLGIWLIAPFNPPLTATLLLLAGSVGGAAGAYVFARKMRSDWKPSGPSAKIYDLLRRRGGLATQTALRMFPGFPHSVVNFACGVLRLPFGTFLAAAVIGLAVKWGVYANAVHGITDAVAAGDAVSFRTLWPLFALAALLLAGTWLKSRIE